MGRQGSGWSFSCPKTGARFVSNEKVKPEVKCCYLKAGFSHLFIASGFLFLFFPPLNCKTLRYKLRLSYKGQFIRTSCEQVFICFFFPLFSFSR